ncbi:MAG: FliH/SctL family protein [Terracidiphilus sp.]
MSHGAVIEVFQYPDHPGPVQPAWDGLPGIMADISPGQQHAQAPSATLGNATVHAECLQRLAEETRRSFEAGRQAGIEAGRAAERVAQQAAREEETKAHTSRIADIIAQFDGAREHYLHTVEHEVVELALAVAARILRREAQMDPLLLTGAVRVALGQLSQSTEVRLKVPDAELDLWSEALAHIPKLTVKPEIVPVAGMRTGECEIDTALGSVDLGIRAQLGEIERGFFDRAGRQRAETRLHAVEPDCVAGEKQP